MNTAAQVLRDRRHVLLDFDGPVCAVFGATSDRLVADRLRELLPSAAPADVAATKDPFDVLRYATTQGVEMQGSIEGQLCRLEVEAVAEAPDTPGASDVLRSLNERGHTVTIVSNNSVSAIRTYLHSRNLIGWVHGISAREPGRPLMLKPHPHMLQRAIRDLTAEPAECVMVGDSVSDIHAAYRASTAVIAVANKPGKRDRFASQHPSAIVDDVRELIARGQHAAGQCF